MKRVAHRAALFLVCPKAVRHSVWENVDLSIRGKLIAFIIGTVALIQLAGLSVVRSDAMLMEHEAARRAERSCTPLVPHRAPHGHARFEAIDAVLEVYAKRSTGILAFRSIAVLDMNGVVVAHSDPREYGKKLDSSSFELPWSPIDRSRSMKRPRVDGSSRSRCQWCPAALGHDCRRHIPLRTRRSRGRQSTQGPRLDLLDRLLNGGPHLDPPQPDGLPPLEAFARTSAPSAGRLQRPLGYPRHEG